MLSFAVVTIAGGARVTVAHAATPQAFVDCEAAR